VIARSSLLDRDFADVPYGVAMRCIASRLKRQIRDNVSDALCGFAAAAALAVGVACLFA
jgi:hypothetical protein